MLPIEHSIGQNLDGATSCNKGCNMGQFRGRVFDDQLQWHIEMRHLSSQQRDAQLDS